MTKKELMDALFRLRRQVKKDAQSPDLLGDRKFVSQILYGIDLAIETVAKKLNQDPRTHGTHVYQGHIVLPLKKKTANKKKGQSL